MNLWTKVIRETLTSKYYLSDCDDTWTNWLYTVYVMHLSSSISRLLFLNLASGIFGQGREENYYIRKVFKSDSNWRKLEEISFGNGKPFTVRFRSHFIKSWPQGQPWLLSRPRSSFALNDDWFLIIQRISWCNSID